jgi:hypothetical protein
VVLFGIDGYGWSFLFGLATALSTAVFVGGVVHLITRDRNGWWACLSRAITALLLAFAPLAGFPLALLGGVLSFKNSYREVGAVDGHAIVVQQFAGWRGADSLSAGYRDGPFVSSDAQNDSYLRWRPGPCCPDTLPTHECSTPLEALPAIPNT